MHGGGEVFPLTNWSDKPNQPDARALRWRPGCRHDASCHGADASVAFAG